MTSFFLRDLPEPLKIALGLLAIGFMALVAAAQKMPHVKWLQAFRMDKHLTLQQKERLRRSNERMAGVELILIGIVVPIGYLGLNVMFFNEPTLIGMLGSGAISLVCIALGITAIAKNW